MSGIKFSPGTVVATPGVLAELTARGDDPLAFLVKHIAGDWGEVGKEDWNANEWSLAHGERLLSVYTNVECHSLLDHHGSGSIPHLLSVARRILSPFSEIRLRLVGSSLYRNAKQRFNALEVLL